METLFKGTSAYRIYCGDKRAERLSHAYMLYLTDDKYLRFCLKRLALKFFGAAGGSREEKLILSEGLPDLKVYPAEGGKLTAEVAASIVEDAQIKPLEFDRKLYIISGFETASPIFQNKLLKILEEPPKGVYFLLGAASLSPVLITVKSRVKLLEVPPFSERQIYAALERAGQDARNAGAAKNCGGVLSVAENILKGGWYDEVTSAARELCSAATVGRACAAAVKYGDIKYKSELLAEMQRIYFGEIKKYAENENYKGALTLGANVYAANAAGGALTDIKFNANFASLLYDFTLRVATENEKW